MKLPFALACVLLVGACSSAPQVSPSYFGAGASLGPTSASDPRLRRPQFYRDEGDSNGWLKYDAPLGNR